MTWNDFYQRQRAIDAVVEHANQHPDRPLTPAPEHFANLDELLAALQYKWTQALTGRIDAALLETRDDPEADNLNAVSEAWRRTAADNAALRAVLDRHTSRPGPAMRAALEREQRMLALTSGLAEHTEPTASATRVGRAFLRLLQIPVTAEPTRSAGRFRRLIPSL